MSLELFTRQCADNDARRAEHEVKSAKSEAESLARHERTERSLQRWARLGVREARKQRERQREFDLGMTRLAAAQLVTEEKLAELSVAQKELSVAQKVTEEKLAAYLSSLTNGHNGGSKS